MVRLRFNHEEKVWDEIAESEPKNEMDIVFDRRLKDLLDGAKKDIKNDLDVPIIACGEVGSGKSTILKLCCRYMSNERFDAKKHMIKSFSDIKPVIKNAVRGQDSILLDEMSKLASATGTMTKGTKFINEVMDVCRQKNLFIAMAAPYFHRLGSQIAIDRAKILIRTYIDGDTGKRGKFAFYGTKKKEILYRYAKANYGSLRGCQPKYRGTFGDDKTNQEVYRQLKDDTLNDTLDSYDRGKIKPPTPKKIIQERNLEIVRDNMNKNVRDMAELLGVSKRTIERLRSQIISENREKVENLRVANLLKETPTANGG